MTNQEAISKLKYLISSCVGREEIDQTCYELLDYLHEQEPRLMTSKDMDNAEPGTVVWLEQRDEIRTYLTPMIKYDDGMFENRFLGVSTGAADLANTRFWSVKPSEEQRKATPW